MAACAWVALPGAVAQEAEPTGTRSGAAARVLRLIDDPSARIQRALSADSINAPGGLWNAAALLQAELSDEEKLEIILAGIRGDRAQRGVRRSTVRFSRARNQRYDSGRQRRGGASRHRQQASRIRNSSGRAAVRGATREAREALRDSALTAREHRQAIAEAVREAAAAERQAAIERARQQQLARDAALGIDGEARAAMDAELATLRARADSLSRQAGAARRALRSFHAERAGAGALTPAQREVIRLHEALGRLLQSRSRRDLSRKR